MRKVLQQIPTSAIRHHQIKDNRRRANLLVSGYLVKPFSIHKLNDILREFAPEPRRVLVIDDDQDFVRLLSRNLSALHYHSEVIGANN